jgi:hypothetical protein
MCKKCEKTIQLEGYEYKQCEHGYCYQHDPKWEKDCSCWDYEYVPLTNAGLWTWFKKTLNNECYHSGLIVGLFSTVRYYIRDKHHCGIKTNRWEKHRVWKCVRCGRVKKELVDIVSECLCCGYRK